MTTGKWLSTKPVAEEVSKMLAKWKEEGKSANSTEMQYAIYGWATEDPQAALAWLNGPGNADYPQKEQLIVRVLAGAALSDADLAIRMLAELPESSRIQCVGHFTWNLIQNQGIDRAVDWMIEAQRNPATRESAYAKRVEAEVSNHVMSSSMN